MGKDSRLRKRLTLAHDIAVQRRASRWAIRVLVVMGAIAGAAGTLAIQLLWSAL